ncbi:MAG: hypothetical protein ACI308_00955 [Muribaculaceae bacterium]
MKSNLSYITKTKKQILFFPKKNISLFRALPRVNKGGFSHIFSATKCVPKRCGNGSKTCAPPKKANNGHVTRGRYACFVDVATASKVYATMQHDNDALF